MVKKEQIGPENYPPGTYFTEEGKLVLGTDIVAEDCAGIRAEDYIDGPCGVMDPQSKGHIYKGVKDGR